MKILWQNTASSIYAAGIDVEHLLEVRDAVCDIVRPGSLDGDTRAVHTTSEISESINGLLDSTLYGVRVCDVDSNIECIFAAHFSRYAFT